MKRILATVTLLIVLLSAQSQNNKKITVIKGIRTALTPKLSKWKPDFTDPILLIKTRDEKGLIFARDLQPLTFKDYGSVHTGEDPVLQKSSATPSSNSDILPSRPVVSTTAFMREGGEVGMNYDGIGFANVSPGDPTIAVGPNHIIQMVNGQNGSSFIRIFNKASGTQVFESFMDQLPGSSYNGAGDCITWYDQFTDRYVMSEFGDSSKTGTAVNSLIMAVSQTNDPLGSWYVYEFADASFFPDYPKYGNWTNAWFGMTRDFINSYAGNSIWAFDKNKMIAGDPTATVQRIRFSDGDNKYNSMCPVSVIGSTAPPAGSPGLFLYYNDDNYTSSSTDADSLGIIAFTVDFNNPSNSNATVIQSLAVAPFKSNVCNSRNCAPTAQGRGYDVISSRIMNKPYYRNFGSYQAIVANHTVDATGSGVSGIRWYELRKANTSWTTYQQGTFAPQSIVPCINTAEEHRFMGSVTLNSKGQIALAYNNTSAVSYGSISFTGRNDSDPLNIMSYEEVTGIAGTNYGTFGNRWGDYNDIVPDLSNDSVFWFTGMYGRTNSWKTRVMSFTLSANNNLDARLVSIDYPNSCENTCSTSLTPRITFRNAGSTIITSLLINYQVNGGSVLSFPWTGSVSIAEQVSVALPATIFPPGNSIFNVFLTGVNGNSSDDVASNDSLSTTAIIGTGASLPLSENFENVIYPPPGWVRSTNTLPVFNWERTTAAGHTGMSSVFIDNFNNNQAGKHADLKSPVLNISGYDSLSLTFWVAAASYDLSSVDTLQIMVSSDCGISFKTVWKQWGPELNTSAGFVQNAFLPASNEWRQISVDLNDYTGTDKLIIAFRNINGFGNNIFLDDINIIAGTLPRNDATAYTIIDPFDFTCSDVLTPNVRFVNLGVDTLKTVKLNYTIDNGSIKTLSWSGALAKKQSVSLQLQEQGLTAGNHKISIFTAEPNGTTDQVPSNDTAYKQFQVKKSASAPVEESFEDLDFLPEQWNAQNPVDSSRWRRNSQVGFTGTSSLFVRNFNHPRNISDIIVSPLIRYASVDSVLISFKMASAAASVAGNIAADTLEVLVSDNCGTTFTSVYKKWGKELETLSDLNTPVPVPFVPRSLADWRNESVNVTTILGTTNSFVVAFRNFSQGANNLYIDDVNIYTKTLAPKLKKNGYLITPNPFRTSFVMQHFPNADGLKAIRVFSSLGQLVYQKNWALGTADSFIEINLNTLPSGLYIVQMMYADRVVSQKVIKGN